MLITHGNTKLYYYNMYKAHIRHTGKASKQGSKPARHGRNTAIMLRLMPVTILGSSQACYKNRTFLIAPRTDLRYIIWRSCMSYNPDNITKYQKLKEGLMIHQA